MLSIEYVIRLIILLIVLTVLSTLILNWYEKAKNPDIFNGNDKFQRNTEVVEKDVFTSRDIAKYIDSCYRITGEKSKDFVCYVLQGTFEADENSVKTDLISTPPEKVVFRTDFINRQSVIIRFQDLGDKIIVS